jgi:hypothetical protein
MCGVRVGGVRTASLLCCLFAAALAAAPHGADEPVGAAATNTTAPPCLPGAPTKGAPDGESESDLAKKGVTRVRLVPRQPAADYDDMDAADADADAAEAEDLWVFGDTEEKVRALLPPTVLGHTGVPVFTL